MLCDTSHKRNGKLAERQNTVQVAQLRTDLHTTPPNHQQQRADAPCASLMHSPQHHALWEVTQILLDASCSRYMIVVCVEGMHVELWNLACCFKALHRDTWRSAWATNTSKGHHWFSNAAVVVLD
jgi:hypothetical protein